MAQRKTASYKRLAYTALALAVAWWGMSSLFSQKQVSTVENGETEGASRALAMAEAEPTKKPYKVGIQAGHWKNNEVPDEFGRLRIEGTGTSAGGVNEWEVNLDIAERVAELLGKEGIVAEVLPATVPPGYQADAFISIHADGNEDISVSGFKVTYSAWDEDGEGEALSTAIETSYAEATGMEIDPNTTEDMQQYYAFNFNRFVHTIDPDTTGIIVEVGFLTSAKDRQTIVRKPQLSAEGIAEGIISHFSTK
ncbi:MAG: cell wall hydrolase/autolysin [Patescibacteria group bacterium]|jgi:N-acetylmuramoyl-L-alanine amidase|nr:cell wall hydrolase/autolysin [Patescibacteria group bacterium]